MNLTELVDFFATLQWGYLIFVSASTVLTLAVAVAIGRLIYCHVRQLWIERRNVRDFAATLPESERVTFLRHYRQRGLR